MDAVIKSGDGMRTGQPMSRRAFIAAAGAAGAGFVLYAVLPGGTRQALAAVPGGALPIQSLPKFQTPLLIPPVMPKAGTIVARGGKNVDYYEISMRQISQQILPEGMPPTTVWGYGAVAAAKKRGLLIHNAPSLTIEAMWNRPVRVKWINDLVDERGSTCPTSCLSTRPCTGPIRPGASQGGIHDPRSLPPRRRTTAPCRS